MERRSRTVLRPASTAPSETTCLAELPLVHVVVASWPSVYINVIQAQRALTLTQRKMHADILSHMISIRLKGLRPYLPSKPISGVLNLIVNPNVLQGSGLDSSPTQTHHTAK